MAALLLIPFFLLRFGLLALLGQNALPRAAHFAPMQKGGQAAYWLYQLSNLGLLVCLFFLRIRPAPLWLFLPGLAVYLAGAGLLAASVVSFAAPAQNGLLTKGAYRFSRNPMYLAYFVFFLGCALLTQSLVLLGTLLVFQVAAHFVILAEEQWCLAQFGKAYTQYMGKVRRYL